MFIIAEQYKRTIHPENTINLTVSTQIKISDNKEGLQGRCRQVELNNGRNKQS